LLDGALQTTLGLVYTELEKGEISGVLPFSVDKVRVYKPLSSEVWVWTRYAAQSNFAQEIHKVNIDICDSTGEVLVQFIGLAMRAHNLATSKFVDNNVEVLPHKALTTTRDLTMVPVWTKFPVLERSKTNEIFQRNFFCIASSSQVLERLKAVFNTEMGVVLESTMCAETLTRKLANIAIEHIVWALDYDSTSQSERVQTSSSSEAYLGFNLVKALLSLGYENRTLNWVVYTQHAYHIEKQANTQAFQAALGGFLGSVTKEYPQWRIFHLDTTQADSISSFYDHYAAIELTQSRKHNFSAYALREGIWYQQELQHYKMPISSTTRFRKRGVYLIIGGGGGLGFQLSQYLVKTYQAKLIWFGRRELDADIKQKLDLLEGLGCRPSYYGLDVGDAQALQVVSMDVLTEYSSINGIVHSAGLIKDKSVAQMGDSDFLSVLSAKADITVNIDRVFRGNVSDFVLFFSSIQSFGKEAGQGNYAAGCQFQDSYASHLCQLYDCPVRIINWGFWGGIGMGAPDHLQKLMTQLGIESVTIDDAVQVIEQALNQPMKQVIYFKINQEELHPWLVNAKHFAMPAQMEG
jgi:NAD(P)-dependent dehydrogenase (short-subunit alcohol dehydrogenase family)